MKKQAFNLTGIDPKFWREFKAACAYYGISIRGTFLKHAQNIIDDYLAKMKELFLIEKAIEKGRKKK